MRATCLNSGVNACNMDQLRCKTYNTSHSNRKMPYTWMNSDCTYSTQILNARNMTANNPFYVLLPYILHLIDSCPISKSHWFFWWVGIKVRVLILKILEIIVCFGAFWPPQNIPWNSLLGNLAHKVICPQKNNLPNFQNQRYINVNSSL